jgi:hypothetical protein
MRWTTTLTNRHHDDDDDDNAIRVHSADTGQRRSTTANDGPRRPTTAHEGHQRAHDSHAGHRKSNVGPRRPTRANEGLQQPAGMGPNLNGATRRLGPGRSCFLYLFFYLLLIYDIALSELPSLIRDRHVDITCDEYGQYPPPPNGARDATRLERQECFLFLYYFVLNHMYYFY